MMNLINFFRLIALLEGLSYVLLLFIAVPVKYLYNEAFYVKILGMPHGILFMVYILLSILLIFKNNWIRNNFFYVMVASVVPFGTFVVDFKFKKTL
tara:strand:+ start:49 stop:336 length:288 start_codon:yes stop_codon:yes gene_type:complete